MRSWWMVSAIAGTVVAKGTALICPRCVKAVLITALHVVETGETYCLAVLLRKGIRREIAICHYIVRVMVAAEDVKRPIPRMPVSGYAKDAVLVVVV